MSNTYYVFAIKCTIDNSYYLGVSTKKTANSIAYMLSMNRKDETKYVKFTNHVKKYTKDKFICTRLPTVYEKKEDAEQFVYKKLIELEKQDRVLNDSIINPERVECQNCHQRIRTDFLEKHQSTYCQVTAFSELTDLFP